MDLDEQLARQLMLEDQQQQRYASGTSWTRRGAGEVPYQQRQQPYGSPPPGPGVSGERPNDQLQEFQRTMGQIAESGKRTFSSIVSRVKAKINEYEQSRYTPRTHVSVRRKRLVVTCVVFITLTAHAIPESILPQGTYNLRSTNDVLTLTCRFFLTLIPLVYFFIQHKVHRIPGG